MYDEDMDAEGDVVAEFDEVVNLERPIQIYETPHLGELSAVSLPAIR